MRKYSIIIFISLLLAGNSLEAQTPGNISKSGIGQAPAVLQSQASMNENNLVAAPLKQIVTNTFIFTADMRTLYGTGRYVFDPNQDSLLVMGMDWDSLGTVISGNRTCMRLISPALRWRTSLVVRGYLGDSTKWKFKAFPDGRFKNNGWEYGSDHWVKFQADGSTVSIHEFIPQIQFQYDTLTSLLTVLFQIDLNVCPGNRYNDQRIPLNQINFIGLKGELPQLGSWGGNWTANDTVGSLNNTATMIVLNDQGLNGDITAGDHIWSRNITLPTGTEIKQIEYRFGCMYPGADTLNNGIEPLDNECPFGANHIFLLKDVSTTITHNFWNNDLCMDYKEKPVISPGKIYLGNNYPNPFNPVTKIDYYLPESGYVSIKVYNVLGETVVSPVAGYKTAGQHTISLDASKLPAGIYFYSLQSGKNIEVKKMTLLK